MHTCKCHYLPALYCCVICCIRFTISLISCVCIILWTYGCVDFLDNKINILMIVLAIDRHEKFVRPKIYGWLFFGSYLIIEIARHFAGLPYNHFAPGTYPCAVNFLKAMFIGFSFNVQPNLLLILFYRCRYYSTISPLPL